MDIYQVGLGALILVWAFIYTILCVYSQWRLWRCCAEAQVRCLLNMHGQLQSWARCLNFGLKLFSVPFFEFVSSKGSGDAAHKRMRVWVFAIQITYRVTRNMNMIVCISLSIAKPFQSNLPNHFWTTIDCSYMTEKILRVIFSKKATSTEWKSNQTINNSNQRMKKVQKK